MYANHPICKSARATFVRELYSGDVDKALDALNKAYPGEMFDAIEIAANVNCLPVVEFILKTNPDRRYVIAAVQKKLQRCKEFDMRDSDYYMRVMEITDPIVYVLGETGRDVLAMMQAYLN